MAEQSVPSSKRVRENNDVENEIANKRADNGVDTCKKADDRKDIAEFSAEQQAVFDRVLEGQNVFFTGAGGTGKSYLLNRLRACFGHRNDVFITATTGIAATHIGGCTLNSFAGVGLGEGSVDDLIADISKFFKTIKRWQSASILIVDEVSMWDPDLFEKIEAIARHFRRSSRFFGGLQTIFVGDFCQLPPVSKDRNKPAKLLFQSPVWQASGIHEINLKRVFRQSEELMIDVLTDIRFGLVTQRVKDFLTSVCRPLAIVNGIKPTKLFAHNANVDAENNARLVELPGEPTTFKATSTGNAKDIANLAANCLAPDVLKLKVGAQVMHLVNSTDLNLVNGSRGVVTGFRHNMPLVQFVGRQDPVMLELHRWDKKIGNEIVASRFQIPLKLAWAITIHKSQGMSIDFVEVNLKGCFQTGQAYVALSRATCNEGLAVTSFEESAIVANPLVIDYYRTLEEKQTLLLQQ